MFNRFKRIKILTTRSIFNVKIIFSKTLVKVKNLIILNVPIYYYIFIIHTICQTEFVLNFNLPKNPEHVF